MKSKVFGYTQRTMIDLGMNLRDITFVDWFVHWYSSRRMKMITVDDSGYYGWVNREYVIDQLPILGLTHVESVTKMLSKLVNCGVLERIVIKSDEGRGSNAFYRPSPIVFDMKHDSDGGKPVDNSVDNPDQPAETLVSPVDQPADLFAGQARPASQKAGSNTTIKDNTTINIYTPDSVSQKPKRNPRKPRVPDLTLGCEENVRLTTPEYERLVAEHSEDIIKAAIEELSMWKAERGRPVKRDDLALRRWAIRAAYEKMGRNPTKKKEKKEIVISEFAKQTWGRFV